ncbi:hypothetical protein FACS18948_0420 [Clostridia bacterium]|nr:hypothetical protein FACS18948_0420 [Clostridia bacterium]
MIGCKVELNTVGDYSMFAADRDSYNFDLFVSAWYSDYNDPLDFLHIFGTGMYGSYGQYSSAEYDALLDSLTGLNDSAQRFEIYQQLEAKLLLEDSAAAPLWYADQHFYIHNWVQDFNTSSFGGSSEVTYTSISGK